MQTMASSFTVYDHSMSIALDYHADYRKMIINFHQTQSQIAKYQLATNYFGVSSIGAISAASNQ